MLYSNKKTLRTNYVQIFTSCLGFSVWLGLVCSYQKNGTGTACTDERLWLPVMYTYTGTKQMYYHTCFFALFSRPFNV